MHFRGLRSSSPIKSQVRKVDPVPASRLNVIQRKSGEQGPPS
jgi:hypothetical protein